MPKSVPKISKLSIKKTLLLLANKRSKFLLHSHFWAKKELVIESWLWVQERKKERKKERKTQQRGRCFELPRKQSNFCRTSLNTVHGWILEWARWSEFWAVFAESAHSLILTSCLLFHAYKLLNKCVHFFSYTFYHDTSCQK